MNKVIIAIVLLQLSLFANAQYQTRANSKGLSYLVQTEKKAGEIKLKATSENLRNSEIVIKVE